jgi:hypothetical protein
MQNALAERVAPAARPAPANSLAGLYFDPRYEAVASNPTPQFDPTMRGARDYAMDPRSVGNQIVVNMATSAAPVDVRGGARAVQGIRAYHGSPHRFDRFSMDRIGTGEGAQAYGHGLYFADNEGVARAYRDTLSQRGIRPGERYEVNGRPLADALSGLPDRVRRFLDVAPAHGQYDQRAEMLASIDRVLARPDAPMREALEQARDIIGRAQQAPRGSMYEVNLRVSPDRLLDWDAPLYRQSPEVREGVANVLPPASWGVPENMTGAEVWRRASEQDAGAWGSRQQMAAEALRELGGIEGIRYLDGGSRAAGEGSRNYVIFNDALIDILRRYGLLGMVGGGAAATAGGEGG